MRLNTLVNQALAPLGVRIVREPKPLPASGSAGNGQGETVSAFFPHVAHRGRWEIPADLASRREAWAVQLCRLYARPASWPASIAPEVGMLIHALVRNIRPSTVVETGTCLGASTIWIAAALAMTTGGTIHTFDMFDEPGDPRLRAAALFKDREQKVRARFRRSGLARHIEVHVGPSADNIRAVRDRLAAAGGVELAFIDADHTPRGVALDVAAVEPVLRVGGYLLFHDVYPATSSHLGPREIVDHIGRYARGTYQACDLYTAPANYGLALLRRLT